MTDWRDMVTQEPTSGCLLWVGPGQVFQRNPERAPRGGRNGSRTHPEVRPRGTAQWQAKLTDDVMAAMRATVRCGAFSARQWSRWLGVSYTTTKRAVTGETWRHVAAILVLVASAGWGQAWDDEQGRFWRFSQRTDQGRSTRGFDGNSAPFFEFAPASGAGMGTACACAAVSGAKGEALTFARTGSAICYKGSKYNPANGDFVSCGANLPRIMPGGDGSGPSGLLIEEARTNDCLQSQALCSAPWADVGTPSCTAGAATGPFGTATMAQLTDASAVAFAGRSQVITTSSLTHHAVSVYVKAGTATKATITMVGTGNSAGDCTGTVTGLSSTTSTLLQCASAAAYGVGLTAVTVSVLVGTAVADTGTLFVEQAQHEAAAAPTPAANIARATSPIPTTAAAVTRNAETANIPLGSTGIGSVSYVLTDAIPVAGARGIYPFFNASKYVAPRLGSTVQTGAAILCEWWDGTTDTQVTMSAFLTLGRGAWQYSCQATGSTSTNMCYHGACQADVVTAYTPAVSTWTGYLGSTNAGLAQVNGVVKQVCVDPSSGKCGPANPAGNRVNLAWLGDSIVFGTGSNPQTPPAELARLTDKGVFNLGVGGYTAAQCATQWTTNVSGKWYRTLLWSCGVNSLAAAISGATTWATAQAVLDAAVAQGMKVVVTSIMPWKQSGGWTAGTQTETLAYNSLAQSWASTNSQTFVDLYALMGGGTGGTCTGSDAACLLNAYDSGDHIHPNPAGGTFIASTIGPVLP